MTRNKKIIIAIILIAIAAVGYWLASPLFFDKRVSETMEDIKTSSTVLGEPIVISVGSFVDADDFHKGEGTVKLIKTGEKYFVRFEDDFKVTNGPDLFVYFGKNGEYVKEARIGLLKGNIGGQNYEVPAEINPLDYDEIWIWCRAFSTPFASATIVATLLDESIPTEDVNESSSLSALTKQSAEDRNKQRRSDVNTILNAVWQYAIDNHGILPASITTTETEICNKKNTNVPPGVDCTGLIDLSVLVESEEYIINIPKDPQCDSVCSPYGVGYTIRKTDNDRVTITAHAAENSLIISVTR